MFMPPLNASYFFLSPLPTNCEGSVPCFQIPRLGSDVVLCLYIVRGLGVMTKKYVYVWLSLSGAQSITRSACHHWNKNIPYLL